MALVVFNLVSTCIHSVFTLDSTKGRFGVAEWARWLTAQSGRMMDGAFEWTFRLMYACFRYRELLCCWYDSLETGARDEEIGTGRLAGGGATRARSSAVCFSIHSIEQQVMAQYSDRFVLERADTHHLAAAAGGTRLSTDEGSAG